MASLLAFIGGIILVIDFANCQCKNDGTNRGISYAKCNALCTSLVDLFQDDKRKNPCKNNKEYESNCALGSCYKFHPTGATWVEAKAICVMEGAELAMVNSQKEADHLKVLFQANQASIEDVESAAVVRLGLRKINKEWRYPDGTKFENSGYSRWAPGEPNNPAVNHCGGILLNGLIDDIRCMNQVAFICEGEILN